MTRAWCWILALVGLIASCPAGNASTINFTGNFIFDDDVAFFTYLAPGSGVVTVHTDSFAAGGFAPILALYSASGTLLFTADGVAAGDCGIAGPDSLFTPFCYDTQMSWDSLAGTTYYVALSQYDNFAIADLPVIQPPNTWNTSTTFLESGDRAFTAGPPSPFGPGCGASHFCLNEGFARGSAFSITFDNGPPSTPLGAGSLGVVSSVPETSSIFLILGGLAMFLGKLLRIRSRRV